MIYGFLCLVPCRAMPVSPDDSRLRAVRWPYDVSLLRGKASAAVHCKVYSYGGVLEISLHLDICAVQFQLHMMRNCATIKRDSLHCSKMRVADSRCSMKDAGSLP